MLARPARRAAVLAVAAVLVAAPAALADTVGADGDVVAPGVQTFVDLGTVAPGATISRDVSMTLFCAGVNHVDPGQVVTVSVDSVVVPAAGGSISATSTTVGPVPPAWPNDTSGIIGCDGPYTITSTVPSHVTIVAPTTVGSGYDYAVVYAKSLSPAGVADGRSVSAFTSVTFQLAVGAADTTPPTFSSTPPNLDLVTTDPAGLAVSYNSPTATDDQDPSPTVACLPASGATFPLGTTTVGCSATDAAGNHATTSFTVTIHLASVAWDDPVQGGAISATRGRSVPIKARAWLDGVPVSGPGSILVAGCGPVTADPTVAMAAAWQSDAARWMAVLDTSGLAPGCHRVSLVGGGLVLGSFQLDVVAPPSGPGAAGRLVHHPS